MVRVHGLPRHQVYLWFEAKEGARSLCVEVLDLIDIVVSVGSRPIKCTFGSRPRRVLGAFVLRF